MSISHAFKVLFAIISGSVLNFASGSFYGTNLNRSPNIFYEIICSGANSIDLTPYWVSANKRDYILA